jgi:hypothetical protein
MWASTFNKHFSVDPPAGVQGVPIARGGRLSIRIGTAGRPLGSSAEHSPRGPLASLAAMVSAACSFPQHPHRPPASSTSRRSLTPRCSTDGLRGIPGDASAARARSRFSSTTEDVLWRWLERIAWPLRRIAGWAFSSCVPCDALSAPLSPSPPAALDVLPRFADLPLRLCRPPWSRRRPSRWTRRACSK